MIVLFQLNGQRFSHKFSKTIVTGQLQETLNPHYFSNVNFTYNFLAHCGIYCNSCFI